MTHRIKPMRPCDVDMEKLCFPYWGYPKFDGVHGIISGGYLTGRSGKKFANKQLTSHFSIPEFDGFNGEVLHRNHIVSPEACRAATSLVNTIDGGADNALLFVFDFINEKTKFIGFERRIEALREHVGGLRTKYLLNPTHPIHSIVVVDSLFPPVEINDEDTLLAYEEEMLNQGHEGIILRKHTHYYRSGKMTARIGSVLRKKRFKDSEFRITALLEGVTNENDAFTDPNGYTERSTEKDGLVPSGMVGTLLGFDIYTGQEIRVSPGKMTHEERRYYWNNPDELVGKIGKYQHFPKGVKDKPRQSTFQCLRAQEDL